MGTRACGQPHVSDGVLLSFAFRLSKPLGSVGGYVRGVHGCSPGCLTFTINTRMGTRKPEWSMLCPGLRSKSDLLAVLAIDIPIGLI